MKLAGPTAISIALAIALPARAGHVAASAPAPVEDRAALDAELKDVLEAQARWEEQAAEFEKDVQEIVERRYEDKRSRLVDTYEVQLRQLEVDERAQRLQAIARFEQFIARYPAEPRATPDAMFRLSELYFEQSKDQQRTAQLAYEDALLKAPEGATPPAEPPVRFDNSIALYQALIARFPGYHLLDGAYYLLAYVLDQQGEAEQARDLEAQLIEKFPQSRFVPEAWMRIGEYWFDANAKDANAALAKAADAYTHVAQAPNGPLYDKGLYKLGWTWYRLDRYDDAIDAFARLIDVYAARQAALPKGAAKEASSGELRDEALQYTAISFADGGVEKAQAFFAKLGGRPWEAELFRRLGDVYFDQDKQAEAVAAYRIVLAKAPTAEYAPQIQQRIVQSFERDRDFAQAWKERDALVRQFGEGSPWFEANKSDPETLAKTRELMEHSLHSSAIFHHQQAQSWKKAGRLELALQEFQAAAVAYGTYLDRFPNAKDMYETRFFYAETLYNSLQFVRASEEYALVRDDQTDGRYLNESAYAVVLALQREIERLERAGKMDPLPLLKASERPADKPAPPIALEDIYEKLVVASDTYVLVLPKDEKAPEVLYKTGEVYYRHNQFEEARRRFRQVVDQYPDSAVAQYAGNLTLETYLAEKDWQNVEDFAGKQLSRGGKKIGSARKLELSGIKQGARFKRASSLMEEKKYDEAAKLFVAAVDEDPKVEFADKALNNAAFCYQQELRFDSALKIYERLFTQYPRSQLADTALFLVGFSAEKAFDFDTAIEEYNTLVDHYPQSPKRADALYNLAHALERLQRYGEAAQAYARYAELFPDREDAPAMLFQGAVVAERRGDWKQEIADLTAFIRKFNRTPKQNERVVQAYLKTGLAFKQAGNEASARQAFTDAVYEYDKRGLQPADLLGAASAAEAKFNLAEFELQTYDRIRIEAHGHGKSFDKSLKAALTNKAEERERVLALYKDVALKYKRPDWIVAALYRIGYIDERFAASLLEAPVPPELKKLGDEYVAQYQDTLSQASIPIDERAMEAYKKAIATARELKIANEWTRHILESLDKYDHTDYPLLKDAKQEMLLEPLSPTALDSLDGSPLAQDAPTEAPVATSNAKANAIPASSKLGGDDK